MSATDMAGLAERLERLLEDYENEKANAWDRIADFVTDYPAEILIALRSPCRLEAEKALREALASLRNFESVVFNDNGDVTLTFSNTDVYDWLRLVKVARNLDDALAALASPGDDGWRDVDNAPSDTDILLGWFKTWPTKEWKSEAGYFSSTRGGWRHSRATHWRPLPPPPVEDGERK